MDYKTKAFIVGALGDIGLQIIAKERGDIVGLQEYFEHHGRLESVLIASGMMFSLAYLYEIIGFSVTNINLFLYGGSWDIIFRNAGLSNSLNETYYKKITPVNSFIWGGIPMVLPNLF